MIQKELAGKSGYSANVALLIFITKISGNHICNSALPSSRSHCSFLAMLCNVQYAHTHPVLTKPAEKGFMRQPHPSASIVILVVLHARGRTAKESSKMKHKQQRIIEMLHVRYCLPSVLSGNCPLPASSSDLRDTTFIQSRTGLGTAIYLAFTLDSCSKPQL